MITSQDLIERIQKNVGVPWESQHSDGVSDGILFGSADANAAGVVTTFTPTLDVLRKTVASGKNAIICREAPSYSRGERAPLFWRNGPAPSKELLDNDAVWQAKQEFISKNNLVIIRFFDNWDARKTDGQLRGLSRALGWESFHLHRDGGGNTYDFHDIYLQLPKTSLNNLAAGIKKKLNLRGVRVISKPEATVSRFALAHGLLLVADAERILREPGVDVVITGDSVEWEAAPYFQDLVAAGRAKGLIMLGDEASEEPGGAEMAEWLKGFVNEVPIQWIPASEPFWTLS